MKVGSTWLRVLPMLLLLAAAGRALASERETPFVVRRFPPTSDIRPLGPGIAYGPHRDGQRPGGPSPTKAEVREDLRLLAARWSLVRTYGSVGPTDSILAVLREDRLPLKVMHWVWIAPPYFSLYNVSLGASWQTDLFGRVRRESEAAQAQVYGSEQGRRGFIQSVVTSIAASYINLRALDRQLEIARATAENHAATQKIFDLRFKGGVVSQVEVAQVDSQYQQALAAIPALEQQIAAQENLLSALLGRNPGPIPRGKTIGELIAPAIPEGLPLTLLERRPDILQAEQNLVAANANIGVARSLYFPTLSLTSALGSVSNPAVNVKGKYDKSFKAEEAKPMLQLTTGQ